MTQQTIDVEGLPEGWKAVAYRYAYGGEHVLGDDGPEQVRNSVSKTFSKRLIVEKIQPRRIVLEETEEISNQNLYQDPIIVNDITLKIAASKIWKEVKE